MPEQPSEVEQIREFLRYAPWGPVKDDYLIKVQAEADCIRAAHPDGDYPTPVHGPEEMGACVTCDSLRFLDHLETCS